MTIEELRDRIETWLDMRDQIPLSPPTQHGRSMWGQTKTQWEDELLNNAAQLEVPGGISPEVGALIEKTADMARTGNRTKLPEIEANIRDIHERLWGETAQQEKAGK